ncbi:RNaseH domain-containing protein [Streptomyces griseoruber]|uniref:RNaseH domain-containing protein n=1 Tax=Streptomyces griseoruber TaxID=1943 RepID=UPI0037999F94
MGCGWSARTAPPAPGGPPTSPVAVLVTPRAPGGGPARVEGWGPDADDGAGAWAPYPAMLLKLTRVGRGEAPSSRIARCRRRTAVRPARLWPAEGRGAGRIFCFTTPEPVGLESSAIEADGLAPRAVLRRTATTPRHSPSPPTLLRRWKGSCRASRSRPACGDPGRGTRLLTSSTTSFR